MKSVILLFAFISAALLQGCSDDEPTNIINKPRYFEITNPAMNTNVPDSTTIKITTDINNLLRVELYIDYSQRAVFREAPYEYSWYTIYYEDGSQHILQAVGYDKEGNKIESKYVLVDVYRFMPSNLMAFITSDSSIDLSWTDNCTFETGFEIEEAVNDSNFFKIAEIDSNITNYNLAGEFRTNNRYLFRMRAKSNELFSGYSDIAVAEVMLKAPDNLDIAFIADTAARLSWNDNNDFESGYVIEKATYYGSTFIKEVPANTTETVISDSFIAGNYYTYYIHARMGYIHGDHATFPHKTVQFNSPYHLTLESISTNSLKLKWLFDHSFEIGYIVQRSSDGFQYTEIGRTSSHNFTDTNLDTAYHYSYRISAYSRYNISAPSNSIEAYFTKQLKQINKFIIPGAISYAALSADASYIAFGSYEGNEPVIPVYDTFTGQHRFTLSVDDSLSRIFMQITIHPDNRLLAAAGDDRYITVWDINSGAVVNRISNVEYPHVLKFTPGGKYLIVEKRGALRFYDVQTWQYTTRISTPYYITDLEIDRNESIIATTDGRTNVTLWDFNSGVLLREIPQSVNAHPLEFNKSDTRIYSVINTDLFAWDVNSASVVLHISNFLRRNCIAINEEENIAVGSYGSPGLGVWELSSGNFVQNLSLNIEELFFSPNNYLIGRGLYPSYYIWEIAGKWVSPIQ